MRLRNKQTGKVIEWFNNTEGVFPNTLAELNKDWEDVSEEEVWYLGERIGNYSMPKKEADIVTEKILAWKRLKENGFSFESWDGYVDTGNEFDSGDHFECCGFVNARGKFLKSFDKYTQFKADLDLLFGGEE